MSLLLTAQGLPSAFLHSAILPSMKRHPNPEDSDVPVAA